MTHTANFIDESGSAMLKLWNEHLNALEQEAAALERQTELYSCGDGVYLRIFEDITSESFAALKVALWERFLNGKLRENRICDNLFASVEYRGGYLYAIYIPCRRQLRLLTARTGRLMPNRLGEKARYAGEQRITQISPDPEAKNFGMCYVITLGVGHFLVYDGLGSAGNDEEKLYQALLADTPTGQKPVIDAWLLTHPHYDHIAGVQKFAVRYAQDVEVAHFVMNTADPHRFPIRLWREVADCYANWLPAIRRAFPRAEVWKVHTGQRFAVGSAEVEVLLTQEEIYPGELIVNDTSLVTRVFLNGKRLFFPADISGEDECLLLHDMYGSYLRSEYYQIAHHAWDTEALLFYSDVDPQTLFWPLRLKDWDPANRMWTFPATKVMKREMDEQKREFLIAQYENITVNL